MIYNSINYERLQEMTVKYLSELMNCSDEKYIVQNEGPIYKTNGVKHGISIKEKDSNVGEMHYIEDTLAVLAEESPDVYKRSPLSERMTTYILVAHHCAEIMKREFDNNHASQSFVKNLGIDLVDFNGFVRPRLWLGLINCNWNESLLISGEVPYSPFCDDLVYIAKVVVYDDSGDKRAVSSTVTSKMLALWGQSWWTVFDIAQKNVLAAEPTIVDFGIFKALTNKLDNYGAALMSRTDILDDLAWEMDTDVLCITPSSVHEVLVMDADWCDDEVTMRDIIGHVNKTEVSKEEQLSDHPYYYDVKTKRIASRKEELW